MTVMSPSDDSARRPPGVVDWRTAAPETAMRPSLTLRHYIEAPLAHSRRAWPWIRDSTNWCNGWRVAALDLGRALR
ncbi:hypothetical protein GCM10008969_21910 [Pseudomonas veronii subsp. inensis]